MSFSDKETSRYSAKPVELYLFVYGDADTTVIAYTTAEQAITFGTNPVSGVPLVYQPVPLSRGKITMSGTLDKATLTVTVPQDSSISLLFRTYPPSSVTSLTVRQGHVGDGDFKVVWMGRVLSHSLKKSQAELTCQSSATSMRRVGLRRRYQYGCPLVLYGADCRANKTAATSTLTVDAASGSRVTIRGTWAGSAVADKYVQGIAEWTNGDGTTEVRTILRAENGGTTFQLSGPVRDLAPGASIKLIYGCNHRSGTPAQPDGDCGPLHANVQNFGGQEYIPFKSPFGTLSNPFY